MKRLWRRFLAASAFLTTFHLPPDAYGDDEALAESPPMFPLVGALLGAIVAGFDFMLSKILPLTLVSVADLALGFLMTGGLHFDGLLDTADGMFSSRPRERILEIMKDSRVGAMGVTVGILQIGLKIAAISSMDSSGRLLSLFLAPTIGRYISILAITAFPYVRTGGGLGNVFKTRISRWWTVVPGLLVLGMATMLGSLRGAIAFFAAVASALWVGRLISKRLGGLTGDVYGALFEIAESVVYIAFAANI